MSNFTMTTGTYTDYYNLMEKIRDQLVLAGFTIESFKVNVLSGLNKGYRLHAYKGGTFIAVAGASNADPDYLINDQWVANSIKGICVKITAASTNNSARWNDPSIPGYMSTMQCGENNSFWIFTRGESFILCNRFTARKYGYLNFMREVGYNGITYQYVSGSYSGSRPTYSATYSGLPQFAFIGKSSTTSGAGGVPMFDTSTNTFTFQATTTNQHVDGTKANSDIANSTNGFLGYGIPSSTTLSADSSIIRRTKTPFSEKYTPLPIEFFEGGYNGFVGYKRFMIQDLFVILMDTYEAEEIFTIGNERFIALPFLEKSATNTYTEVFGFNMGIAVKIGVV